MLYLFESVGREFQRFRGLAAYLDEILCARCESRYDRGFAHGRERTVRYVDSESEHKSGFLKAVFPWEITGTYHTIGLL